MSKSTFEFILGFTLGFLSAVAVAMILASLPFSNVSKYNTALKECEKSIPRDQQCKVIGVIDNERKD